MKKIVSEKNEGNAVIVPQLQQVWEAIRNENNQLYVVTVKNPVVSLDT